MSDSINLALQLSTGRPLCVLLQAAFGGNSTAASGLFDGRHWVVAQPPAADITFVAGSVEQWRAYSRALDGGINPLATAKARATRQRRAKRERCNAEGTADV